MKQSQGEILYTSQNMKASTHLIFLLILKQFHRHLIFHGKNYYYVRQEHSYSFPPFEEWQLWLNEMKTYGIQMTAKFPQDVEVRKRQVYKTIFKDDELTCFL
jgi:hypothetical protein